jgi:hypothetical protein
MGYVEQEFFVAGSADSYTSATLPLPFDGLWSVTKAASAAFKTRIIVRRPIDATRFNGTVVVEWLNVTGGLDAPATWDSSYLELLRAGFAWVGVSAQSIGINGEPGTTCPPAGTNEGLKCIDPVRYASLVHPGDSFSYDIFTQAGEAVREPGPGQPDPMGGLKIHKVIATGDSQSAIFLTTYIDGIQPLAKLYDGFLVQSRAINGGPLSEPPQASIPAPLPTFFRTDQVPILVFTTETDLIVLAYFFARQPDDTMFRDWEVAGTSHADLFSLTAGTADAGAPLSSVTDLCTLPINDGPMHYVLNAAFQALNGWLNTGTLPPIAPRINVNPGPPPTLVTDPATGNVMGGIRTPIIDVPFAAYSGLGNSAKAPGPNFCILFGTTIPYSDAQLDSLYGNHGKYVSQFVHDTNEATQAGFILAPDAQTLKQSAAHASVP